jgi:hypothetical protein
MRTIAEKMRTIAEKTTSDLTATKIHVQILTYRLELGVGVVEKRELKKFL